MQLQRVAGLETLSYLGDEKKPYIHVCVQHSSVEIQISLFPHQSGNLCLDWEATNGIQRPENVGNSRRMQEEGEDEAKRPIFRVKKVENGKKMLRGLR